MLTHLGRPVFPDGQVEQKTNKIKYKWGRVGVIHVGGTYVQTIEVLSNVLNVKDINLLFEILGEKLLLETLLSKKTSSWSSDWQAAPHHHLLDMMSRFGIKKQRGEEQLVRACAGSTSLSNNIVRTYFISYTKPILKWNCGKQTYSWSELCLNVDQRTMGVQELLLCFFIQCNEIKL